MSDYFYVLLLALLPAAGNFAGGLIAEAITTSRRLLSRALHAAAGILIAVVGVELMPEALGGGAPPWAIVIGLCLGGAFYIALDWAIDILQKGREETAGAFMIYAAVVVDLFSDGLLRGDRTAAPPGLETDIVNPTAQHAGYDPVGSRAAQLQAAGYRD